VADEKTDNQVPDFRSDVPETGTSIVKHDEARALAKKIAGEELPNECHFHCITCGWSKTLQFEEDEIEALGGDITGYGGPCPECSAMTLVPRASLMGDDVGSVYQQAKANRRAEFSEQADVFIDKVQERVGAVMAGSTLEPRPEEVHDPANVHDPRPPSQREEDYPDADDVDTDDMKPRTEG
jgi:hypothetical protein